MNTIAEAEQVAHLAIYAARHMPDWGEFAAVRYCQKRGVPLRLYCLACALQFADAHNRLIEFTQMRVGPEDDAPYNAKILRERIT